MLVNLSTSKGAQVGDVQRFTKVLRRSVFQRPLIWYMTSLLHQRANVHVGGASISREVCPHIHTTYTNRTSIFPGGHLRYFVWFLFGNRAIKLSLPTTVINSIVYSSRFCSRVSWSYSIGFLIFQSFVYRERSLPNNRHPTAITDTTTLIRRSRTRRVRSVSRELYNLFPSDTAISSLFIPLHRYDDILP